MKKRILTFCLAVVLLVATVTVPVLAAVPEDQQSMVNFLDQEALDGFTGYVLDSVYDDIGADFVLVYDENLSAITIEWEGDELPYDQTTYYMIIEGCTYADIAPNLSEVAFNNGIYYGISCADSGDIVEFVVEDGQNDYRPINNLSELDFESFMASEVVIAYSGFIYSLTLFYYPAIYQDPDLKFYSLDVATWDSIGYYCWTPYNEEYFLSDNTDGSYDEGYEEGYQAGLNEFVDDLALPGNIFSYATYEVRLSYDGERVYTGTIVPDITNSSVNFYGAINRIGIDYTDATIIASWSGDYVWVYGTYQLGITGLGDADVIRLNDSINGKSYYLVETDDSSKVVRPLIFTPDQQIKYPVFVNSLEFYYMEGALANASIVVGANDYNNGYNAGFASGVMESKADVYQDGYNDGVAQGFITGKAEGLELAERGDWRNLFISVVEAPLHVFNSLFNFEVLGLDMRGFMASMFTLCLLVIVFDKFLGGI